MTSYLFFDSASTTPCAEEAIEMLRRYGSIEYGNPSSTHHFGNQAARALKEARTFFAGVFRVDPQQVIFTGSGSEANNLAIYGIAIPAHFGPASSQLTKPELPSTDVSLACHARIPARKIIASQIEHPSVRGSVKSLSDLGIQTEFFPVSREGKIDLSTLSPETALFSCQQVNNIVGLQLPVEGLAKEAKAIAPQLVVHCDAVQAFGKVPVPSYPSAIDLISISGHKIGGPKGVGALIVLNRDLIKNGKLRPQIFGGAQENGFRAGTQNVGLIAGFHRAAQSALENQTQNDHRVKALQIRLRELLIAEKLLSPGFKLHQNSDQNPDQNPDQYSDQNSAKTPYPVCWNSPPQAIPYIVSLSVPGVPAGPLAKLLEERGCLVSVGSACSARKPEPDPVLSALGFPLEIQTSAIRVSFSPSIQLKDIDYFVQSLKESIDRACLLLGKKGKKIARLG